MASVKIEYGATDITANVLFATARFTAQVNGVAGACRFRVRDLAGDASYQAGAEIVLSIDDEPAWVGYAQQVKRVYAFPAQTSVAPERFFDIEGADLNLLFERRIVFDQVAPENILAPLYPAGTADTTALTDLFADWLDLSGDDIDTSSGVTNVGDITVAQSGRAWSGAYTFGQAMASIARLPGAVFYINPARVLKYVDDETVDAPFGLSDQPNGTTLRGYREFEVLYDGTRLANDVFAFGLGYGSASPVAKRITDTNSLAVHGRWQQAQTVFGTYKQDTIDYDAESMIYGSPEHLRGAKDDRVAVTCITLEPGLGVGQKLTFESLASNFTLALPIRKMEIDFPAPTTPRFKLTLSFEIDAPFSLIDNYQLPALPPLPGLPTFPGGGCFLDLYNRPNQQGFGTATSGQPYTESAGSTFVSSGVGLFGITGDNNDGLNAALNSFIPPTSGEMNATIKWGQGDWDYLSSIGGGFWHFDFFEAHGSLARISITRDGTDTNLRLFNGSGDIPLDNAETDWLVHAMWDGSDTYVNVWAQGDPEPAGWMDSGSGIPTETRVRVSSAD